MGLQRINNNQCVKTTHEYLRRCGYEIYPLETLPNFDDCFNKAFTICTIVNGVVGWIPDCFMFHTQHSCKNAMKSSHPKVTGNIFSRNIRNPLFHFSGSLIGQFWICFYCCSQAKEKW